jgi:Vault protein inter-alpha-trypsin domain
MFFFQTLILHIVLHVNIVTNVDAFGCMIGFWGTREVFFPLRSMYTNATISDGVAKVSVEQFFEIVTDVPLGINWKMRYEIPFDEQGAIFKFQASYGNRIVEGIVKSDDDAKKEFDKAIEEGKPAFLG